MKRLLKLGAILAAIIFPQILNATKLIGVKTIDKDYIMVHFRDGEVRYRDNGTGPSAYLGHTFVEGDDTLVVFGQRLDPEAAAKAKDWTITSKDDKSFGRQSAVAAWRKSKPMNTDNTLTSELDHWIFLQLPKSMKQGSVYTVSIPEGIGADAAKAEVKFDIWSSVSEAVHVNIIGYSPEEETKAADLYLWLGDQDVHVLRTLIFLKAFQQIQVHRETDRARLFAKLFHELIVSTARKYAFGNPFYKALKKDIIVIIAIVDNGEIQADIFRIFRLLQKGEQRAQTLIYAFRLPLTIGRKLCKRTIELTIRPYDGKEHFFPRLFHAVLFANGAKYVGVLFRKASHNRSIEIGVAIRADPFVHEPAEQAQVGNIQDEFFANFRQTRRRQVHRFVHFV